MSVETSAIRAAMLADFGTTATWTPAGGSATSVTGIFDNTYEALDAGGSVSFSVQLPRFLCATETVASAKQGDQVVVDGVTYLISIVMDDGTGMTELALERQ